MPLLQVQTLDDLLKLMAKQKTISTKAVRELNHEVDRITFLYKPDHTLSDASNKELSNKVITLLSKYAEQPTLSEFYQHPSWDGGFIYGGSFGVSAIVGCVFLKSWAEIFPEFSKIMRSVMMRVLEEQSKEAFSEEPANDMPMIDRILPAIKFTIRDQNGVEILGKQRDKMMYTRVANLLQIMATSFITYKILEQPDNEKAEEGKQIAARLTQFGNRVYLHLRDVEIYITEVSELYPKLSKNKIEAEPGLPQ